MSNVSKLSNIVGFWSYFDILKVFVLFLFFHQIVGINQIQFKILFIHAKYMKSFKLYKISISQNMNISFIITHFGATFLCIDDKCVKLI